MATCQSCRKQFPEDAKHCPHCGAAQQQVAAEQGKNTVFGYAPSPAELLQLAQGGSAAGDPPPPEIGAAGAGAAPVQHTPSPSPVGFGAVPAQPSVSRPPGQLDVMAKTMFPNDLAGAEPHLAQVRATGTLSVTGPPVREDPELALGETIAAPATPLSGPGMLSPSDTAARTAVTVTDSDDSLGGASPSDEVKWGGGFKVLNPGFNTPVSGRTLGRFVGQVPAGQEQVLQAMVLEEVNSALGTSQIPLEEIDPQGELLENVNIHLAPKLQSLGVAGRVTEIRLSVDQPAEQSPGSAAAIPVEEHPGQEESGGVSAGADADARESVDDDEFAAIAGAGAKRKVIFIAAGVAILALVFVAIFIFRA